MKAGKMKDAVLAAMGNRDEMSLDEMRAAIFAAYSEAELLRRGTNSQGKDNRSSAQKRYAAGEPISVQERAQLLRLGLKELVKKARFYGSKWIVVDEVAQVARRVRPQLVAEVSRGKASGRVPL